MKKMMMVLPVRLNKVIFMIGIFLLVTIVTIRPALAIKKYALLIGVSKYKSGIRELPNTTNDVTDLIGALDKAGWTTIVPLFHDITRNRIILSLENAEKTVGPNDEFLLFFAGHGVKNTKGNNETYWLTRDADIDELDVEGIRVSHLMDFVNDIKAGKKLILLDHCFAGDVKIKESTAATNTSLRNVPDAQSEELRLDISRSYASNELITGIRLGSNVGKGTILIAASRGYAYETGKNGILSHVLLEAFRSRKASKDEDLTIRELVDFVEKGVKDLANKNDLIQEASFGRHDEEPDTWLDLDKWIIGVNLPKVKDNEGLFKLCEAWQDKDWLLAIHPELCKRAINAHEDVYGEQKTKFKDKFYIKLTRSAKEVEANPITDEQARIVKYFCVWIEKNKPLSEGRKRNQELCEAIY